MSKERLARFGAALALLAETFNETLSQERAEIYIEALADMPIESLEGAARSIIQYSKFFPRPAEWRQEVYVGEFLASGAAERLFNTAPSGRRLAAAAAEGSQL